MMLDAVFAKKDDLLARNIAGETLIVPIRGRVGDLDSIFTLNDVGYRIWSLLDGQTNVARIVETIRNEYDVAEETATQDVTELLSTMAKVGLVCAV